MKNVEIYTKIRKLCDAIVDKETPEVGESEIVKKLMDAKHFYFTLAYKEVTQ